MSQENVEVMKRTVEVYRRGDIDAVLEEVGDEVEFDFSGVRGPYRGVYRGREAVRDLVAAFLEVWESITPLSSEYFEVGDTVVVAARARFSRSRQRSGGGGWRHGCRMHAA
jgi:ketosteroid isomerase-like protein